MKLKESHVKVEIDPHQTFDLDLEILRILYAKLNISEWKMREYRRQYSDEFIALAAERAAMWSGEADDETRLSIALSKWETWRDPEPIGKFFTRIKKKVNLIWSHKRKELRRRKQEDRIEKDRLANLMVDFDGIPEGTPYGNFASAMQS